MASTPDGTKSSTVMHVTMRRTRLARDIVSACLLALLGAGHAYADDEEPAFVPLTLGDAYRSQEHRQREADEEPEDANEREAPPERPSAPDLAPLDRVIDRATYVLGPGDEVAFGLWGQINAEVSLTVAPDGRLSVPSVGPIAVSGLSVDAAERHIAAVAGRSYAHARVTLSLVRLRTFRVHVAGLVVRPGSYTASAAYRLADVIALAGGPAGNASMRRVVLIRAGGDERVVDLSYYNATGVVDENPITEMGDAVRVQAAGDSVGVWGAVGAPGSNEYRPGDTLQRLLTLAGGVAGETEGMSVEWASRTGGGLTTRTLSLDAALQAPHNGSVRAGDAITCRVPDDSRQRHSVQVVGDAKYPGTYAITSGVTRLSEVISRAGGLTDAASPTLSFVARLGLDGEVDPEFGRLSGMSPGEMSREEYAYFRLRSRQRYGSLSMDFAKALRSPGTDDDPVLFDGDIVHVQPFANSVEVIGQVNTPGLVDHVAGNGVDYYIGQAGGTAWDARSKGIRVIKAGTGVWEKPGSSTVIEPGDAVFVPQREPVDYWALAKDIIGVTAQVATVVLLLVSVSQ